MCISREGELLVTGENMGTLGYRLVRRMDENGKPGRAEPMATNLTVTRIVELYYSKLS